MGTEISTINLEKWLALPPEDQSETLTNLCRLEKSIPELRKAIYKTMAENGMVVPGFTICEGKKTVYFSLDEQGTMDELRKICGETGLDIMLFMRPKSEAVLRDLLGVFANRILSEKTGDPSARKSTKKEEA